MSLRDYFSNNKIFTGTEKPTQGKFDVGDIIVNIGPNSAEEPMWICVEAGTPGVWELCSGVNEEEIADIVQANALSAIDYTDGVDIQIDGGEIGNMNELQTTDKSSIVGAINELFQNVDSGKQLIADAIDDENITKDSTFVAMSEAIEQLHVNAEENRQNIIDLLNKAGHTVSGEESLEELINDISALKKVNIISGESFSNYSITKDFCTNGGGAVDHIVEASTVRTEEDGLEVKAMTLMLTVTDTGSGTGSAKLTFTVKLNGSNIYNSDIVTVGGSTNVVKINVTNGIKQGDVINLNLGTSARSCKVSKLEIKYALAIA